VLTETTAEIAAALTLAAARRVVEADSFMRNGHYKGWLPTLFIGNLLQNKTVRRGGIHLQLLLLLLACCCNNGNLLQKEINEERGQTSAAAYAAATNVTCCRTRR
jgi:hypothetical protein